MKVKDLQGRPPFRPGSHLGYFLWQELDGFHLLWMSKGDLHGFRGKIIGKDEIKLRKLVKLESNDLIKQVNSNTITWETRTQNDTDGLIFETTNDFTLELYLDSNRIGLNSIFCGRTMRRPLSNPFIVNLK
ncbi:MAG: hypothetical protein ACTSRS_14625 [Candidatus Helarchaeota archaeon]